MKRDIGIATVLHTKTVSQSSTGESIKLLHRPFRVYKLHKDNIYVKKSPVRGPLPVIAHQFREPEARPPRAVSDVFALACAAPLLLLLVMWASLGANFRAAPAHLAAPLFHLALAASLGLYGLLWIQLDMFSTLRLLLPLAALTFLSGHRLLRRLASDKARKQ